MVVALDPSPLFWIVHRQQFFQLTSFSDRANVPFVKHSIRLFGKELIFLEKQFGFISEKTQCDIRKGSVKISSSYFYFIKLKVLKFPFIRIFSHWLSINV